MSLIHVLYTWIKKCIYLTYNRKINHYNTSVGLVLGRLLLAGSALTEQQPTAAEQPNGEYLLLPLYICPHTWIKK